jgi:hypothetical protein
MRSHRIAITIAVLAALTGAAPALARNGTLLSGYGGPGQGNQAVLGSTMLGGNGGGRPGGSGGSSAADSEASESPSSPSLVAGRESSSSGAVSGVSGAQAAPSGRRSGRSHSAAAASGAALGASRGAAHAAPATAKPSAAPVSLYPAAERIPSGGQGEVLGFSAADLLYIIIGAGVLVSLGVITRRLAAASPQHGARR